MAERFVKIVREGMPVTEIPITTENVRLKRTDDGYQLEITRRPEPKKTEK